MQPFAGIRILDFTRYLAGPFGTYQMALLGAEVIKVEPPGGDDMRYSQASREWSERGLSPAFLALNGNKRSIALDLTKPAGADVVLRLAASADVVWENFRPGVMEKLGIGDERLRAVNPRLVYCAVSGFGQSGPERETAAFDGKMQAMSGIMSLTGHEEMGPTRAGFALCDTIGGMTAAFAVAGALYRRAQTGQGEFVDVAMLDAALSFIGPQVAEYTVAGHRHRQFGNLSTTRKPTGDRFACAEGDLMLAVMTDRQFANLMRSLGREDALADPRFADWPARIAHRAALREIIEAQLAGADAATWEARLTAADVPCARIRTIAEIMEHPQVAHRGLLQPVETDWAAVRLVGSGFRLGGDGGGLSRAAPRLGQDSTQILHEAGYDEAEIAGLLRDKVIIADSMAQD